uniref:Uncharacterized protein n=1 Tax=Spongospora subterranea TaxID=70186 RepID=A0A0H5QQ36_9EUKA|eukprot:CRZ04200.1 hypothetical protein [Spongospora subterranea]
MRKSLQRALLLGGQQKFVRITPVDCGLLLLCNPPISKDLVVLSDFASDFKFCNSAKLRLLSNNFSLRSQILSTNAPSENRAILAVCLIFLRLLIAATNEQGLDRRIRIANTWSAVFMFSFCQWNAFHDAAQLGNALH